MTSSDLYHQILQKKSFLCIGLDTDIEKIPRHLLNEEDPVFEFNRQIIEATSDLCIAYKPNLAFYESLGPTGLLSLEKTLKLIPKDIFTIADAKRGDIGNTSNLYARAFFEYFGFDSITVNPYMGRDSVTPFLEHPGKWAILLALTSNAGSMDFQQLKVNQGTVFEEVIRSSATWGTMDQLMYVVGATKADYLAEIRKLIPEHFLLIPGVGAQGGDLESVTKFGINDQVGLIVNSSRGIIYGSEGPDFAKVAREKAKAVQLTMQQLLDKYL